MATARAVAGLPRGVRPLLFRCAKFTPMNFIAMNSGAGTDDRGVAAAGSAKCSTT
jgi:hypothetical protein